MTGRTRLSNRVRTPFSFRSLIALSFTALALAFLGGSWALAHSVGVLGQKASVNRGDAAAARRSTRRIGVSELQPVSTSKPLHGHGEHSHHSEPESSPPEVTPEETVSEGVPAGPTNVLARAIWTAPTNATVGAPLTLDGTASEGNGPLACTWSFEDQSGSTVWETHAGCELPFVFQVADTKYVTLAVRDADGETSSNRQSFVVQPAQEPEEAPADTTPPETTITSQPAATTTETSAGFSFASSESGSTFACKLDAGAWASCTSPKAYSGLSLGAHTFSVRATDAAGNTDATPATVSWTVEASKEESLATSHCYSSPHLCGYPDATNTGASGSLTPSGSITVSTNGAVVKDKEVSGKVTINASNVTIENVKIVSTATGSGTQAISNNGSGNVIRNVTAGGPGTGSNTIEAAIRGFDGVTLERDYFYNCNECMQGTGTVKDTYMVVSSIYSGAHAEDIYVCSEAITVEHSTLINMVNQTATVFGDTICGGGNKYTVKNSLLAGSGYVFYPQANNTNPAGAQTTITGNHIARCLGSPETRENGHWYCKGGSDSNGLYPYGGSYGVGAYFSGSTTWSGNVWDDNLATIPEP